MWDAIEEAINMLSEFASAERQKQLDRENKDALAYVRGLAVGTQENRQENHQVDQVKLDENNIYLTKEHIMLWLVH